MSVEIDILPISDDNSETERLADLIEGVAGEFSPFENSMDSALTASTSARPLCRQAGVAGSSKSKTPTPRH